MKAMEVGEELEVLADDPAAPKDFRAFCETTGATLNTIEEREKDWRIVLTK